MRWEVSSRHLLLLSVLLAVDAAAAADNTNNSTSNANTHAHACPCWAQGNSVTIVLHTTAKDTHPCDPDKVAAGLPLAPALLPAAAVKGRHPAMIKGAAGACVGNRIDFTHGPQHDMCAVCW